MNIKHGVKAELKIIHKANKITHFKATFHRENNLQLLYEATQA